MAPNIISAYKLARTCALMIDNGDFDSISLDYVEIDWEENGENLVARGAHHAELFKSHPDRRCPRLLPLRRDNFNK